MAMGWARTRKSDFDNERVLTESTIFDLAQTYTVNSLNLLSF
jgi:hypothetical protein